MIAFLPGRIACPFAGVGTRDAHASNRLVVDEPATATIEGSTITLHDDRDCPAKTVIADLVWLAEGPDPFTIHLEVTKTGHAWSVDLHTHEPPGMTRSRIDYEPFEVFAIDRDRREILVDRATLAKAAAHVPLKRRLSAKLTTVRDHGASGEVVLDRSIGIGAFGRGSFLVRVTLRAETRDDIATVLRGGGWALSIEPLTERWLPELVKRDLELFGLADEAIFAPIRAGRLKRGQALTFTRDELRFDGARAPFPRAVDAAREYLEFHMLGGMIAAAAR